MLLKLPDRIRPLRRLMHRAVCVAALLALATTGCGGAKKAASPGAEKGAASSAIAAAIKSRLSAAGYAVNTQSVQGRSTGSAVVGFAQMPLVPRGAPSPTQAFYIQVDFTSPHSFMLEVLVFGSPAAAALAARDTLVACRASPFPAGCAHERQRVVRSVLYSASVDPPVVRDFGSVVALASGRA